MSNKSNWQKTDNYCQLKGIDNKTENYCQVKVIDNIIHNYYQQENRQLLPNYSNWQEEKMLLYY